MASYSLPIPHHPCVQFSCLFPMYQINISFEFYSLTLNFDFKFKTYKHFQEVDVCGLTNTRKIFLSFNHASTLRSRSRVLANKCSIVATHLTERTLQHAGVTQRRRVWCRSSLPSLLLRKASFLSSEATVQLHSTLHVRVRSL